MQTLEGDRSRRRRRARLARAGSLLIAAGLALTLALPGLADEHAGAATADAEGEEAALEEEAEDQAPPLVRSASRLRAQLDAVQEDFDDVTEQLRKAGTEERQVLEKQLIGVKLEFLELTSRLVDNLVEQEAEGIDAAELREYVVTQVTELTPAIARHIDEIEALIGELRNQREELPSQELLAFEQRLEREIDWLDSIYLGYVDNIADLRALGLAYEERKADLEKRLLDRAAIEPGRIELTMQMIGELKERAGGDPDDPALKDELAALNARRNTVTTSLAKLVNHMETMELDATEYQQLLITTTGEVTADIFRPEVAIGLFQQWIDDARRWVRDNGPGAFFKALVFVLILMVAWVARNVTRRVVDRAFGSSRVQASQLLRRMTVSMLSNAVLAIGILVGLSQLGLELGPLLAGLGIAGFIVGFALQDSLANFAAGMMILAYRPFDVGDMVEAAGVRGEVSHMSLVNTTILTIDNRTLIVPNNKIWGDVITNITNQERRRVDMKFGVAYTTDLEHAERVLREIVEKDERVLDDPPPMVKLHELGESGMEFVVRPWAKTDDYWDVYWDVTREVKRRFDEEEIRIPFPQRDVHVRRDTGGEGPEAG